LHKELDLGLRKQQR